ncbi:pentapeptide repeat-containing protein [Halonotius sp. GCM10025705]|uniref:pentapeptide repeat-containing protein n=1 Tax=Halonotius sp. GCM10025705 TaxID=3252678 RepID=UPI0036124726
MDGVPAERCGYAWPRDCDRVAVATGRPIHQSCCFRPTLADADRCLWHADRTPKAATALAEACPSPAMRAQHRTVAHLLDGAILRDCQLGTAVPLANTALTGADLTRADLTGATLTNADLGGALLGEATLRGADLHNAGLSRADCRGADLRNADLTDSLLWQTNLAGLTSPGRI